MLRILLLTQHAPMYMGTFLDRFLSKLDSSKFKIDSIVAFSPVFKASFKDEVKARVNMYGVVDFTKMAGHILVGKVNSFLYQHLEWGHCHSLSNISQKYELRTLKFNSPNDQNYLNYIQDQNIDLVISIACPKILKKESIVAPRLGTINYHTGALPRYRGRQPLFWAKYHKEPHIGITVHEMAPALDAGPILSQYWIENDPTDSLHQTYLKSIKVGPDLLLDALNKIERGDGARLANPNDEATKFTFPTKEEGLQYRKMGLKYF